MVNQGSNPEQQPSGQLLGEFHRLIMDACPDYFGEREFDNGLVIGRDVHEDGEVYAMRRLDITGLPPDQYEHKVSYSLNPDFELRKDYHFVHVPDAASQAQTLLDTEQLLHGKEIDPKIGETILAIGEGTLRAYSFLKQRIEQAKSHALSGEDQVSDEELQSIVQDIKQALGLDN